MENRLLSEVDILKQSKTAMAQWEEKWKEHARINGERHKKDGRSHRDLLWSGFGRALVICGMGESLECEIETLKKYQNKLGVDIATCDKGFGVLIKNGIKPKYVFVADAVVDFKLWAAEYAEYTTDVTLIAAVTSNPEWQLNWLGPVFFYVNKDNIKSEEIFGEISGCRELIPASSNVGNALVVFATQIMGYSEHLLIGYDFAWRPDGNYYAFNDNDKRYWMKTLTGRGINGDLIYTSGNLHFSCNWLVDYFNNALRLMGIKLFNCSRYGILDRVPRHELAKRLEKFQLKLPTGEQIQKMKLAKAQTVLISNMEELQNLLKTKEILNMQVTYA